MGRSSNAYESGDPYHGPRWHDDERILLPKLPLQFTLSRGCQHTSCYMVPTSCCRSQLLEGCGVWEQPLRGGGCQWHQQSDDEHKWHHMDGQECCRSQPLAGCDIWEQPLRGGGWQWHQQSDDEHRWHHMDGQEYYRSQLLVWCDVWEQPLRGGG